MIIFLLKKNFRQKLTNLTILICHINNEGSNGTKVVEQKHLQIINQLRNYLSLNLYRILFPSNGWKSRSLAFPKFSELRLVTFKKQDCDPGKSLGIMFPKGNYALRESWLEPQCVLDNVWNWRCLDLPADFQNWEYVIEISKILWSIVRIISQKANLWLPSDFFQSGCRWTKCGWLPSGH